MDVKEDQILMFGISVLHSQNSEEISINCQQCFKTVRFLTALGQK